MLVNSSQLPGSAYTVSSFNMRDHVRPLLVPTRLSPGAPAVGTLFYAWAARAISMDTDTHVCSNCETRWARKVAVEKKAAVLQAAAAIWAAMVLLMTHFETTTARRCNSGSGSGNHGGSGGVEGGRSGSDGGGKDGWQRGGGTWQQEQRFGQCSGAAARISGRRRATAKMAAAMNGARCGGARRGQSAPSSLPQTSHRAVPAHLGFPEDCVLTN